MERDRERERNRERERECKWCFYLYCLIPEIIVGRFLIIIPKSVDVVLYPLQYAIKIPKSKFQSLITRERNELEQ